MDIIPTTVRYLLFILTDNTGSQQFNPIFYGQQQNRHERVCRKHTQHLHINACCSMCTNKHEYHLEIVNNKSKKQDGSGVNVNSNM